MSCKDDEGQQKNENNTPYYWSLQIARVPYEAGKVIVIHILKDYVI